jgi:hypothetical protein
MSASSLKRGYTLGKGPSIDLFHLGHDFFERFGHQGHEGAVPRPVHRVSEAFDERCGQADRDSLLLRRERLQHRAVHPVEEGVIDG